jgi:hypothetical protein
MTPVRCLPLRGLLSVLAGICLHLAAPIASAGPHAVVDSAVQDLGVVAVGEDVAREFQVHNTGDAPLVLRDIRATVGGKVSGESELTIGPGETRTLRVAVDTWALLGPARILISLTTNEPDTEPIRLELRVDVRTLVAAAPGFARFLVVQGESEGTIAQTLWAVDGLDFRVLEARSPYPYVRVAYREATAAERRPGAAGRQWRVSITLAADAPIGALGEPVILRTDHPRQKEVWIPVSGFVRPALVVTPTSLRLGDVIAGRPQVRSLAVKSYSTGPVEVREARSDIPGVTAEVSAVVPGRSYVVRVTIASEAAPGPLTGTLRILTSSPRQPVIEVPLEGSIAPPGTPEAVGTPTPSPAVQSP